MNALLEKLDASWTLTPPWRWVVYRYDRATKAFRPSGPDKRPYWAFDKIFIEDDGAWFCYVRVAGFEVSWRWW